MYSYSPNPYSKNPIMLIDKHIGYDEFEGMGINGKEFAKSLFELSELHPESIKIFINSMGGDVEHGFDIFNAISEVSKYIPTESVIYGFAYSTAGWCALSTNKVSIKSQGGWMCHMPYNPNDEDEKTEFLEKVANSIAVVISSKSGKNGKAKKSKEEILNMLSKKTFLTPVEMKNEGLVDDVLDTDGKEKVANKTHKEFSTVLNKFINTKTNNGMDFSKVINRLKLAEGSGEESVITAIAGLENDLSASNRENAKLSDKLKAANDASEELEKKLKEAQNKLKNAEDDCHNAKNEMDKLKNEMDKAKSEYDSLKNDFDKMKNDEMEAANKLKEEKAKNLIESFVVAGKVTEEARNAWTEKAKNDFEGTKMLLELIPTNMSVPKPFNHSANSATNALKPSSELKEGTMEWHKAKNRENNELRKANIRNAFAGSSAAQAK